MILDEQAIAGDGLSTRKIRRAIADLEKCVPARDRLLGLFRSRNIWPVTEYLAVTDKRVVGLNRGKPVVDKTMDRLVGAFADADGVIALPDGSMKMKLARPGDAEGFNEALRRASNGKAGGAGAIGGSAVAAAPVAPAAGAQGAPVDVLGATGAYRQEAVGESKYVGHLASLVRGKEPPMHTDCLLVHQPDNPHDRNAVQVVIGGGVVGYLPREDAEDYAPVLSRLQASGRVARVPAMISWREGGDLRPGVWLDLGPAEWLVTANELPTSGDVEVLPEGNSMNVAKVEGQVAVDLVRRHTGQPNGAILVYAILKSTDDPKTPVEVEVDGVVVGRTTSATARHVIPQMIWCRERGKTPVVAVSIQTMPGVEQVRLMAARAENLSPAWYNR